MKKTGLLLPALLALLTLSCKEETNGNKEAFFPAIDFIKSQVAHIDTSLYSIIQLKEIDSTRTDTIYIPREKFRNLAVDFLELPDIAHKKHSKLYTEERRFDETLNAVILTYLPKNPENVSIQRQEIMITPDQGGGDKVKNIIIDYMINNRDSSIEKKMLWQADRSFQVVTLRQMPGQPESTNKLKVIWNDTGDK